MLHSGCLIIRSYATRLLYVQMLCFLGDSKYLTHFFQGKFHIFGREEDFSTVACELRLYMTVDVQKNSIESKEKT